MRFPQFSAIVRPVPDHKTSGYKKKSPKNKNVFEGRDYSRGATHIDANAPDSFKGTVVPSNTSTERVLPILLLSQSALPAATPNLY
jgi:hypothetical protein